ncbi:MAG: DUF2167 domain-containing protein [Trueperaceae bacterium]|nr:DUF2167 domain-containing protein [Trueperaceae bacterium]
MSKFDARLFVIAVACVFSLALAQDAVEEENSYEAWAAEFEASLEPEQDSISLLDGQINLAIPDDYFFLNAEDARNVLTEAWGNPPGSSAIGMIYPATMSLLDYESWAVILTYDDDGYVSDKEAAKINYDKLLKDMQKDSEASNKRREELGYATVDLLGWAAEPHYEADSHKLYWAKELSFDDDPEHTLNYNVRVLGRKGVLNLNAVASMSQLPEIEASMPDIIALAEFTPGYTYADYKKGEDKRASYGLTGLIVGTTIAAKAGLFAKLGALLLAFKKVIVIAVVAIGGFFSRLFKRNSTQV